MSNSTLYLFTNNYPYDIGEEYLEDEIEILAKNFNQLYILPARKGITLRNTPENTSIIELAPLEKHQKLKLLFSHLFEITKELLTEIITSKNKYQASISIKTNFFLLLNQHFFIYRYMTIIKRQKNLSMNYYYSYWTNQWAVMLSLMKKKGLIEFYFSRIHGYDLFEERYDSNYIPFRHLQFTYAKQVLSVSRTGEQYLTSKYEYFQKKFSTLHLGVKDNGLNPTPQNKIFHIVTCSRIDQNKRVELVANALKYISFPLVWTHFGDGDLKFKLEEVIKNLPTNITVSIKGQVKKHEILTFYKTNPVDVFLNVSISEGLPVTLMEAISFGIPIMATDVGGNNEITNETTGILLSKNITPKELASILNLFSLSGIWKSRAKRLRIKEYWHERFNAKTNYNKLVRILKQET